MGNQPITPSISQIPSNDIPVWEQATQDLANTEAAVANLKDISNSEAVRLFNDARNNPGDYTWGQNASLAYANQGAMPQWTAGRTELCFGAFKGEFYNGGERSNKLTGYFFALCGLKTFENDRDGNIQGGDISNVFQTVLDKLSGLNDDGSKNHLSNFLTVEQQSKALHLRTILKPVYEFAQKMTVTIKGMVDYCQKAGLGQDGDPAYNICHQWEANNPAYKAQDPRFYEQLYDSRNTINSKRDATIVKYNPFGTDNSEILDEFTKFFDNLGKL